MAYASGKAGAKQKRANQPAGSGLVEEEAEEEEDEDRLPDDDEEEAKAERLAEGDEHALNVIVDTLPEEDLKNAIDDGSGKLHAKMEAEREQASVGNMLEALKSGRGLGRRASGGSTRRGNFDDADLPDDDGEGSADETAAAARKIAHGCVRESACSARALHRPRCDDFHRPSAPMQGKRRWPRDVLF